jgi:hypothetical protein
MKRLRQLVLLALLVAVSPGVLPAEEPAAEQSPKATLSDLAWMAGHWRGGEKGDLSEEVWTAPEKDSMLGMWRYVAGGKARVFELLAVVMSDSGPLLHLRHFDPKLVAREEKDKPVVLRLARFAPGEAEWEGVGTPEALRITYRKDGEDGLLSILDKGGKKQEFRFRRHRG